METQTLPQTTLKKKLKTTTPYITKYTNGDSIHIDNDILASITDIETAFIKASTTLCYLYSFIDRNRNIDTYNSTIISNIWSQVLLYNTCLYYISKCQIIDINNEAIIDGFIDTLAFSKFSYKKTYDPSSCIEDFFYEIHKEIDIIDKSHLMTYKVIYSPYDFN